MAEKSTKTTIREDILKNAVKELLRGIGEDQDREGLIDTPRRYAKALEFLTAGYGRDLNEVVGRGVFYHETSDMVLVRDVEFYSLCEHHMLPFFGRAHVAYIPNGKIIGLSKIPRLVDLFARRLQVQERLTHQVADAIQNLLNPHGVAVVMEASHLCMMMRGVEKQGSRTITSTVLGAFREDQRTRKEFFALLNGVTRPA